jgi:hypothetical protein
MAVSPSVWCFAQHKGNSGSGGGCREVHLGNAHLGDEGDEGKEPSSLEPHVGAAVGVERRNLGKQANLGDKGDEGKKSHHR